MYFPNKGNATYAFILFLVAAFSDWLDGYLARRQSMVSSFGKLMDALTDKILVLGLCIMLLVIHVLPEWSTFLVLIMLIREFLISGLRSVAATQGIVVSADTQGKQKTVLQLFSVGSLLMYHMLVRDYSTHVMPNVQQGFFYLGIFTFVPAVGLTVYSGIHYILKYRTLFENNSY